MPSCMSQFVNQDSAEFTLTEQPIDAGGKQDTRGKDSPNCRTRMAVAKAHGNAVCYEIGRVAATVQTVLHFRLATLFAYARDQSHKHREAPGHPYNSEDHGHPPLCHVPYWFPNNSERPSPRQVRRPKLIDECSGRHNEIECGGDPDPIFCGGARA